MMSPPPMPKQAGENPRQHAAGSDGQHQPGERTSPQGECVR
jgi:hypothetical protein